MNGQFFRNYADWTAGTLNNATANTDDSNTLTFSAPGGTWVSEVVRMSSRSISAWDNFTVDIQLEAGSTYQAQARILSDSSDTTTVFTTVSPTSFASLAVDNYIQFRIVVTGSATLSSFGFFWESGTSFGSYSSPFNTAIHAGTDQLYTSQFESPIAVGLTVSKAGEYTVAMKPYIPFQLSFVGPLTSPVRADKLTASSSSAAVSVAGHDLYFAPYSTPISAGGTITSPPGQMGSIVRTPGQVGQTVEQAVETLPSTYSTKSDKNYYLKHVFVPDFWDTSVSYVELILSVDKTDVSIPSDAAFYDSTTISSTLTVTINSGTPIDIKPYFNGKVPDAELVRVSIPTTDVVANFDNQIVVSFSGDNGEKLVVGLDSTSKGNSFYSDTDGGTLFTVPEGEVRFWLRTPNLVPIQVTNFVRYLVGSAEIVKPYLDLQAHASVYRVGESYLQAYGLVSRDGAQFVQGTAQLIQPYADLQGYVTIASESLLQGSANLIRPYMDLLSYTNVTQPVDLQGSAIVLPYADLQGSANVYRPYSDLPGYAFILTEAFLRASGYVVVPALIQATATIVPADALLQASAIIERSGAVQIYSYATIAKSNLLLQASAQIINPGTKDLQATATVKVGRSVLFYGYANVERPKGELQANAYVMPKGILDCSAIIIRPYGDLYGYTNVIARGSADLQASANVEHAGSILIQGSAFVKPTGSASLYGFTHLVGSDFAALIRGSAYVTLAGTKDLQAYASLLYYQNLPASVVIVKPEILLQCNATVKKNRAGSLVVDSVYVSSEDLVGVDFMTLTELTATADPVEFPISSFSDTLDFLRMDILTGLNIDSISYLFSDTMPGIYTPTDENANWTYPIKLTNNLFVGETVDKPVVGEANGFLYIGYESNEGSGATKGIHLMRTDDISEDGTWEPAKRLEGNAPSFTQGSFVFTGQKGVYDWIPPAPGDEAYAPEIEFTGVSRVEHTDLSKDWPTILYDMQLNGMLIYPPPQWEGVDPLAEEAHITINGIQDGSMSNRGDDIPPRYTLGYFTRGTFINGIMVFEETYNTNNVGS